MFSETVDRVVTTSKRPDKLADIASYLNQTLRDAHTRAQLHEDSRELTLVPEHVEYHVQHPQFPSFLGQHMPGWQNPSAMAHNQFVGGRGQDTFHDPRKQRKHVWRKPVTLHTLAVVRFDGGECYPDIITPGRKLRNLKHYVYFVADSYVFVGFQHTIDLFFYVYPPHFKYYNPMDRPAVYNRETDQWSFLIHTPTGPNYVPHLPDHEQMAHAITRCSYWSLERWSEVLELGTLARLYMAIDDPRAPAYKALYEEQVGHLTRSRNGVASAAGR